MISPEDFASLTYDEQVSRLQALGESSLTEFGVEPDEIRPLAHFENTTFYVRSPQGEFNLRVSRNGYQSFSAIESEIQFLSALRQSHFRVPEPYEDRIVTTSHEDVSEERYVVLFRWLPGEFMRDSLTPVEARLIGRFMAELHDFTTHWTPPTNFQRHRLHDWLTHPRKATRIDNPVNRIQEEDRQFLLSIEEEGRRVIQALPQTSDCFGLIHADFHLGNILFENGEMSLIDFDDCGYGYFYYDFASTLGYLLPNPQFQEMRNALLSGYEEIKPLPPQTHELLDLFIKLRMTGISRWIMDRVDNPRLQEEGPNLVRGFCEGMRKLD